MDEKSLGAQSATADVTAGGIASDQLSHAEPINAWREDAGHIAAYIRSHGYKKEADLIEKQAEVIQSFLRERELLAELVTACQHIVYAETNKNLLSNVVPIEKHPDSAVFQEPLKIETHPRTPLQKSWKRLFTASADDRAFELAAHDVVAAATDEGVSAGRRQTLNVIESELRERIQNANNSERGIGRRYALTEMVRWVQEQRQSGGR